MAPIQEVHLYLYEIPVILIIMIHQIVEHLYITMIRESQVTDSACLTLLHQEVEYTIIQESATKVIHTTATYAVQEIIVDIIHLQVFHGTFIHFLRLFERPGTRVGIRHLGSNIILVTWMTLQGYTGNNLILSTSIGCGSIKIIHTML